MLVLTPVYSYTYPYRTHNTWKGIAMPYKKRGLQMIRDWEPDKDYDPEEDRLLLTTDWNDAFVARISPERDSTLDLIIDPDFMPENMLSVRSMVDFATTTPDWREYLNDEHPWFIFLYDGEMTGSGPRLQMNAVGPGWMRSIDTSLVLRSIEPVRKSEIDRSTLAKTIDGVYFLELKITSSLPQ